jgi:uncharacterized protein (TIGR02186 family)
MRWFGGKRFFLAGGLVLFAAFCLCREALSGPLDFGLADDHVKITSGFTGDDLVIFGSRRQDGDVIVVLEGPERYSVVRRKEPVFGAWVNKSSLRFENTPSYYDYALSAEREADILSADFRAMKRVGLSASMFLPDKNRYDEKTTKLFQEALLRNQQNSGLYRLKPQKVSFLGEQLFRADFHLPSNVPSGTYKVRALLVRDGEVVSEQVKELRVGLTGFSAGVYKFAKEHSVLYGLLCVGIACFAGWLSNTLVQRS